MATLRKIKRKIDNLPATQKMLLGVKKELKHSIASSEARLNSKIHEVKSEIHGIKSEIHGIKSEIHGIKSEIHGIKSEVEGVKSEIQGLKSEVEGVKSEVQKLSVAIEIQSSHMKLMLDGYASLHNRMDRLENNR